jgi:hypothetical protein
MLEESAIAVEKSNYKNESVMWVLHFAQICAPKLLTYLAPVESSSAVLSNCLVSGQTPEPWG